MKDSDSDDTTRPDLPGDHPDESALDRWRTGELAADDRARMVAHLEACEACRHALAELESFAAAVGRAYAADRELAAAEEPDWARVQARVAEGVASAGSPGREARPRRSAWARWAPQAAAAVVALVVVGVLWREGVRGPEEAQRIAAPETSAVGERAAVDADEPSSFEPESDTVEPSEMGQETETLGRTRAAELEGADNRRDGAEFRGDAVAEEALADRVAPSRDADTPQEGARAAGPPPAEREEANIQGQERANEADKAAPQMAQNEAAAYADPHDRFASQARSALAAGDTLSARRTLALWRDTLAPRDELESALRRQAEALADSLAAFLSALPN
jgi:hypothetical protein